MSDVSRPPTSRWKAWVAAGVAAAVVVIGGVVIITRSGGSTSAQTTTQSGGAAPSGSGNGYGYGYGGGRRPGGRGAQGQISAINGATLTLQTSDQNGTAATVQVTTTAATSYTDTAQGAVGDLAVGDSVVVSGQTSSDGSLAATRIADRGTLSGQGAPNGGQGRPNGSFTAGSIGSIDGSTITVELDDGTSMAVTTSADTAVTITRQSALSDLAVGQTIRVVGTLNGSTVTATAIQSGDLGGGFGGRLPQGG